MGLTFNGKTPESITIGGKAVASLSINGDVVWPEQVNNNYFCIINDYNGSNTITVTKNGAPTTGSDLAYSLDKNTWTTCTYSQNKCTITLANKNDKVYFRSTTGLSSSASYTYNISGSQNHVASGDLRTLLDYTDVSLNTTPHHCFYGLFNEDTKLQQATTLDFSELTILANYCYASMFRGCTSLYGAPELPATSLAESCYDSMFYECISLTTPPELPATTLAENCYEGMFIYCTSLTYSPELPATTLAQGCYNGMFLYCFDLEVVITYATSWNNGEDSVDWLVDVAGSGVFYNLGEAPDIPEDDISGCPPGWTIETSL